MTPASELGQKYATQNYPSQGTQIFKLHGPRIKPRKSITLYFEINVPFFLKIGTISLFVKSITLYFEIDVPFFLKIDTISLFGQS